MTVADDIRSFAARIDAEDAPVAALEYSSVYDPHGWTLSLECVLRKPSEDHAELTAITLGHKQRVLPPDGDWEGRRWALEVGGALAERYGVELTGADAQLEREERWIHKHGGQPREREYLVKWEVIADDEAGERRREGQVEIRATCAGRALGIAYERVATDAVAPTEFHRRVFVETEQDGYTFTHGPFYEQQRIKHQPELTELLHAVARGDVALLDALSRLENEHGLPRRRDHESPRPGIAELFYAHFDLPRKQGICLGKWLDDLPPYQVSDEELERVVGTFLSLDCWTGPRDR